MNKVFDKVVEELEMEMKASSGYSAERVSAFSRAIEIVKQEAEKFAHDTNVWSNGKGVLKFANLLKELCCKKDEDYDNPVISPKYLNDTIENLLLDYNEKNNNGWIPCSEQLPKEDEKVYISTKTERVYIGVYTKRYGFEKREGFICDDGFMWMNTASAWKPYVLPDPYKPKGEIDECRNG